MTAWITLYMAVPPPMPSASEPMAIAVNEGVLARFRRPKLMSATNASKRLSIRIGRVRGGHKFRPAESRQELFQKAIDSHWLLLLFFSRLPMRIDSLLE